MVGGFDKHNLNIPLRANLAVAACFLFFSILVLRLWYLQIVEGYYFRNRSENNRRRTVYLRPPRGMILDRNGHVLVKNRPFFNVELVKEDSPDPEAVLTELANITGEDPKRLKELFKLPQKKRRRFEPRIILKDVSRDLLARVAVKRYAMPGIVINVIPAREYVYGEFAAHTLGYLREITSAQLASPHYSRYIMGDLVGQVGIEKAQEDFLRGQRGVQEVIVNAAGTRIGEFSFEAEKPGHNVTLTLSHKVQAAAEKALADKRGAIVAIQPSTGEVLAMTSRPGFDPNIFTGAVARDDWKRLKDGVEKPLNNRLIQGTYPPGSVFKFVIAFGRASEYGAAAPFESEEAGPFIVIREVVMARWTSVTHLKSPAMSTSIHPVPPGELTT